MQNFPASTADWVGELFEITNGATLCHTLADGERVHFVRGIAHTFC